jgi:hypothetical protein
MRHTMPTLYTPKITPENFSAFRRILVDELPKTFVQWDYQQTRMKNEYLLERSNGFCVDVEVGPTEFIQYCHSTNANHTLETLERFASEKGLREGASDTPRL